MKSSKTAKFIVLEIFPLYGMYVHVLHSHKCTHACMYTQYGYYYKSLLLCSETSFEKAKEHHGKLSYQEATYNLTHIHN